MTEAMKRDEAEIRRIVEDRANALHERDPVALTAHDAPGILTFDLAPPLASRGPDLPTLAAWLGGWATPVEYETRDLVVEVGDGVAFSTSLNRMRATHRSGDVMDLWVRTTLGYRRIDGRWRVVHEHVSVPFYMDGSQKAALDLKP